MVPLRMMTTHNPWSTTDIEIALSPLKSFLATSAEHSSNSGGSSSACSGGSGGGGDAAASESTELSDIANDRIHASSASPPPPSPPKRGTSAAPALIDPNSLVFQLRLADKLTQQNRQQALQTKINDLYTEFSEENALLDDLIRIFNKLTKDFDFFKTNSLYQSPPPKGLDFSVKISKRDPITVEDKIRLVACIKEAVDIAGQIDHMKDGHHGEKAAEYKRKLEASPHSADGGSDSLHVLHDRLHECTMLLCKNKLIHS